MVLLTTLAISFLAGAALAALAALFWPRVLDLLSTRLAPWIERNLGTEAASAFRDLIVFADKGICSVRRNIKALYAMVKQRLLGSKTTYTRISPHEATEVETTYIRLDENSAKRIVSERTIPWESLPGEARDCFIREQRAAMDMDNRESFLFKVEQNARNQGLVLETSTAS